jgi:membrane protease YdiL (CAAX protease family)
MIGRVLQVLASLGLVILFLSVAGVLSIAATLAGMALGVNLVSERPNAGEVAAAAWIGVACTAAATTLLAAIRRRSALSYGVADADGLKRLAGGALVAVLAFAVVVGLMAAAGVVRFAPSGLSPAAALGSGLLWALAMAGVATFEEALFRGAAQFELSQSVGFPLAAGLLSALFGASHMGNSGETPMGIVNVVLVGLLFAWSVRVTGTLWWAIGFHGVWNWLQTFVAGTSNSGMAAQSSLLTASPRGNVWLSGGTVGPEGSVFCILAIAAGGVGLIITTRRRNNAGSIPVSGSVQ